MNAAPVRITLGRDGKRPRRLSRIVKGETMAGAVLCAQQWLVWSNASGRGKREKFAWYRTESLVGPAVWADVASGTLADARLAWTEEDETRLDAGPDVMELFPYTDEPKRRKVSTGRTPGKAKSRLALLVKDVLKDKR